MSRCVIVTGCSRGIGAALVQQLIKENHRVAGCSRNSEAMQELGVEPAFRSVDVRDAEALIRWATDLQEIDMIPDLVIANAGLLNQRQPLWEISSEQFDQVIDVNIKGVANTARAFLPSMIDQQSGTFVALSSGWGRSTSPGVAPYCASKFAVEGLMGALAQELPAGVSAVSLSPGVVHTSMLARALGDEEASQAVEPQQWASQAVDFLLSLGPSQNGQSLSFQR
ncbi:MAG: SDR family NAD(P)-dependent oxidoreductase [Planctomycetota bacterium]|nr:SDR family NAD(P)-dependent oxidoreductase [Planctomycetota bacterium]